MNTPQKQAIRRVIEEESRPLTREEILHLGRRKIPRLGSATVDRTIRELIDSGALIGVAFPGQPRRYEKPAGREHPHFVCRICGKVYDLPVPMALPPLEAPPGFTVTGGEIIYSGRCPACSR